MNLPLDALDLHDIATLVNYERATTEPRFSHTILREAAQSSDARFGLSAVDLPPSTLKNPHSVPVRSFLFDTVRKNKNERDIPTDMLPKHQIHPSISGLSDAELENIFWEVRGHDACFMTIGILQHFFDLFPPSQLLRIRTEDGNTLTTPISNRRIVEYKLDSPRQIAVSVLPGRAVYITGDQPTMNHAVFGFYQKGESNLSTILDLSSMQFGAMGRGKGGEYFTLASLEGFYQLLDRVCQDAEPTKTSLRIGDSPDDPWFKDVARRVKERWDRREANPWCGHCGAPLKTPQHCPCKGAYYCGTAHQTASWKFHKQHCSTRSK